MLMLNWTKRRCCAVIRTRRRRMVSSDVSLEPDTLRLVQTCVICCVKRGRVGQNLTQRKIQPVRQFSILLHFTSVRLNEPSWPHFTCSYLNTTYWLYVKLCLGHSRGWSAAPQVPGVPRSEPQLDWRNPSGDLLGHGQPQRIGFQRQRDPEGKNVYHLEQHYLGRLRTPKYALQCIYVPM